MSDAGVDGPKGAIGPAGPTGPKGSVGANGKKKISLSIINKKFTSLTRLSRDIDDIAFNV